MIYKEYDEKYKAIKIAPISPEDGAHAKLQAKQDYWYETGKVDHEFKEALEKEYGTAGNPKAELLWCKAWEMGHSSGYSEVENYYLDLVELIQ